MANSYQPHWKPLPLASFYKDHPKGPCGLGKHMKADLFKRGLMVNSQLMVFKQRFLTVRIRESKMGNGRLTIDLQLKKRSSENSR
jgi:hypothetical protein